jgi:hypothetical protein
MWRSFLLRHEIPAWWHACGIMLVIALFLFIRSVRSSHIAVVCLIRLPGVVLHELAHFLIGILFLAKPGSFNLIPERCSDGRWTLGSVTFRRITAFNAVPIAFAPLGLLPVAYYLYRSWFNWLPPSLSNTLFLYATLFLLTYNALPSRQDVRVACNWKSVLLYGSVLVLIWYIWSHSYR